MRLGRWAFGLQRSGVDGFCPNCHGRYRFSAKLRFVAVMSVCAVLAIVLAASIVLKLLAKLWPVVADSALWTFSPVVAAILWLGGWMIAPALAMSASARSLLRAHRGSEITESAEPGRRRRR